MSDCGPECTEILREIERFLDDEVEPSVRARVEAHLGDCSPCTDRADFQRHLKELVRQRCAEEVPASLLERIQRITSGM
jgi:mycothiol system anti-sigma-R factor